MDLWEDGQHPRVSSDDSEDEEGQSEVHAALSDQDKPHHKPHHKQRRLATVYDAVAGRITYHALRSEGDEQQRTAAETVRLAKHRTADTPFAPEEVLFRRKEAPQRYAEHDIYHSHERDLPRSGQGVLPESDLVKAIHTYSSRFYGALARRQPTFDGRSVDYRSMDETALLAFGILLEEAGRDVLGRRGDLVFTEGVGDVDNTGGDGDSTLHKQPVGHQEARVWKRANRGSKRRKVAEP